jgi:hypothetical protein
VWGSGAGDHRATDAGGQRAQAGADGITTFSARSGATVGLRAPRRASSKTGASFRSHGNDHLPRKNRRISENSPGLGGAGEWG